MRMKSLLFGLLFIRNTISVPAPLFTLGSSPTDVLPRRGNIFCQLGKGHGFCKALSPELSKKTFCLLSNAHKEIMAKTLCIKGI